MAPSVLVMTPTISRVAGCIISIRPTYSTPVHLLTYFLLTYFLTQNNQCPLRLTVIKFPDFSANDLSSVPLPLVFGSP